MTPNVKLLAYTPEPTRVMALAARLCYTQGMTIEELNDKLTDERCEKLVIKILGNQHHSVMEHAVFTFGVEDVSRNFSHQMVRHRNTSYEQQSLHYTLAPQGFDMSRPSAMNEYQKDRWDYARNQAWNAYKDLVATGIPREEARHILPSGIETKLVMTANVRQWMHFIKIRACIVNCHEITVVAHKIKDALLEHMPYLEPHLGPTCHTQGVCFEGKKYCHAPWKTPCHVVGDGLDFTVADRSSMLERRKLAKELASKRET